MEYVVELVQVKKRYGKTNILEDISVSLEKGKIYGLLGVNGVGKTTLLRIITGLIPNDSGRIEIFGNTKLGEGRRKIGSTIEYPILFESLTALGNLRMYGSAIGVGTEEIKKLLAAVGLEDNRKPVRKFSFGMRQKLALAAALLGEPKLVILDEPTNGLDPIAVRELRSLIIKRKNEQGASFLISSHDVNELMKIADYFWIMQPGKIKDIMDRQELIARTEEMQISMEDYIIGLMEKTNG